MLYIGSTGFASTNNHMIEGFTAKHNVTNLVYYESYDDVHRAIGHEKELKGWSRSKKITLIKSVNPKWNDLLYGRYQPPRKELVTVCATKKAS